ncbi:hypothetical protein NEUTE1DRAFT_116071 [Neurospora tetrasperma FGSC 2508]|uniref:Uncharacterized protein n=1 Tax=Neurospora tetrasperma (strain FGSC 2508 / ATCC MYA-4615 / P0657) TaxID=510951 RepID=F8MCT4_NEUT8|nr:uncharacterized protein NEUTE1DRAFT_116071 [Neurospora tetrasperma FGSC 2508]EGO61332.1 hypothetical protein NEUTE1DRAFT_116071 [Neurospora tetrasperma FGSC 2508]EGZ74651.1 hypothetical protein NEUTE2DRAFT_143413 [Neurospora tetrasperma FGSC 2509]
MKFWLRGGSKGDDLEKPRRLLFLRYSGFNQGAVKYWISLCSIAQRFSLRYGDGGS